MMSPEPLSNGRSLADALASRVRDLAVPPRASGSLERIPDEILFAVRRALEEGDTHYTSRPGVLELRTALVARLASIGVPVSNADRDVVVTAGREEALLVIALALRSRGTAVSVRGLDADARALLRLMDAAVVDASGGVARADVGPAEPAMLIDLGSRLFTAAEPRIDILPTGVWAAWGDLDGLPGLASFRVGFVAGEASVMAGVRTWKQAFSICTAAPSQRAALGALQRHRGPR